MTMNRHIGKNHYAEQTYYLDQLIGNTFPPKQFLIEDLSNGDTPPTQQIRTFNINWSYDIGDDSKFSFRIPGEWYTQTDINIRVVWCINENYAAANGQIQWQLEHESTALVTEQIGSGGTTGTDTSGDIDIPATALTPVETEVATITGTGIGYNDILSFKLSRIALSGGGADPTADPEVIGVIFEPNNVAPKRRQINDYIGYELEVGDELPIVMRIPHDYYYGSDIRVRMGYLVDEDYATAPNGEVNYQIEYEITESDGTMVMGTGGTTGNFNSGDLNIPTTAKQLQEVTLGDIPGTSINIGTQSAPTDPGPPLDHLAIKLTRIAIDDGNAPTANPLVHYLRIEYVKKFPYYLHT